jgi:hypothetical protein
MKKIKLSQTGKYKGKYAAIVDDEDYEYLNQWKWFIVKSRNTYYARRNIKDKNGKILVLNMHRVIMNASKLMQVDHFDHNGLNNQKHNLKLCTNSENQMNREGWGKKRYKGVSVKISYYKGKEYAQIRARITVSGKNIHLGNFNTEAEAALAYNNAALKYHKQFARLNKMT